MKDYWLNTDSRVYVDETSTQRIVITNPEALKNVSANELQRMLISTLGKYEFEMWLAETLISICKKAVLNCEATASIAEISNATLLTKYYEDEDWDILVYPWEFKFRLINLPIFKTLKNDKYEVILEIDLNK